MSPFFFQQWVVLDNVVTFFTLKTSCELLTFTTFGFAEVLPFGVLFGLLKELLEFSSDHGHLFFIKIRTILFQGL